MEPKIKPTVEPTTNPTSESESSPGCDLLLGVAFLIGGLYVIFAFGSFFAFAVGFFSVIVGISAISSCLPKSPTSRQKAGVKPLQSAVNPDGEAMLLRALRDSPTGLSAVEVALATELTVREADRMLAELAGLGYLRVESSEGALFYAVPTNNPAINP